MIQPNSNLKAQTLVTVLLYLSIFAVIATIATIIVVNITKQSSIQESQNKASISVQEKLKQLASSQFDLFNSTKYNGAIDSNVLSKVFPGTTFQTCTVGLTLNGRELVCTSVDTTQNQKMILTCDKNNANTLLRLKVNKDESIVLNTLSQVKVGFEDTQNLQIDYVYTATDTLTNQLVTKIFTTGVSLDGKVSGFGSLQNSNITWPANLPIGNAISATSFQDNKLQLANIKNIINIDSAALNQLIGTNNWNNSQNPAPAQLFITPITSDATITLEDQGTNLSKITCEAVSSATDVSTGGNSTSAKYEATLLNYGTQLGILNYGLGIYKVNGTAVLAK